MAFLLDALKTKRQTVKNLLKYGAVVVNGQVVRQFDHPLVGGDDVTIGDPRESTATEFLKFAGIHTVFEDETLIVVDKPSGLLTVATDREKLDTLFVRLNEYFQTRVLHHPERAFVVHRLDQETSGLVLFAKSEAVKLQLQENWPAVNKVYWAVVEGRPRAETGTIENYLSDHGKSYKVFASARQVDGSRRAITHYRLLKSAEEFSLLELRLETGRKHQLRVHLAGEGCPIVGDERYGAKSNACGRLGLHACRLELPHPVTGQPMSFESRLPRAFAKLFA